MSFLQAFGADGPDLLRASDCPGLLSILLSVPQTCRELRRSFGSKQLLDGLLGRCKELLQLADQKRIDIGLDDGGCRTPVPHARLYYLVSGGCDTRMASALNLLTEHLINQIAKSKSQLVQEYLKNDQQQFLDVLWLLLGYHANPMYSRSPIFDAVKLSWHVHVGQAVCDTVEYIKLMVALGADVNVVDDCISPGMTPLLSCLEHNVCSEACPENLQIVRTLVEHGANVNACVQNIPGMSVLRTAVENRQGSGIVCLLVQSGARLQGDDEESNPGRQCEKYEKRLAMRDSFVTGLEQVINGPLVGLEQLLQNSDQPFYGCLNRQYSTSNNIYSSRIW